MLRFLLSIVVAVILAGCRADSVELKISDKDITTAMQGKATTVPFEAVFSQFGKLDDDQRGQVERIKSIVERYIAVDDFELESHENEFRVVIEGELPVLTVPDEKRPYFVLISPSESLPGFVRVQIAHGAAFDDMKGEIQSINFMLSPEGFHPTMLKISAAGRRMIAPAAEVDGKSDLLVDVVLDERTSVTFSGGPFDRVGAGFFLQGD